MRKYIPVVNEIEGRDWCIEHGYKYCGTRIKPDMGFVMEYEDSEPEPLDEEYIKYLEKQYAEAKRKEQRENGGKKTKKGQYYLDIPEMEEVKDWVVVSEDGYNSSLFVGTYNRYVYQIGEAKLFTKQEAQRKAVMMTRNTKVGRIWNAVKL